MLEVGERYAPAGPAALLAQARLDARDGVPLDGRHLTKGRVLFDDRTLLRITHALPCTSRG